MNQPTSLLAGLRDQAFSKSGFRAGGTRYRYAEREQRGLAEYGQPGRDLGLAQRRLAAGKNHRASAVLPDEAGRHARQRCAAKRQHIENRHGGFMRRFVVLIATALAMVSCTPDEDVTGSIHNKCANELYGSYNSKTLNQCVAVCIKCDRGTTTTCSTSCTLKGAR